MSGWSAADRARRYRELADMHLRLAGSASAPEARASHLELAALWTRLAAQADHSRDGGTVSESEEDSRASASG